MARGRAAAAPLRGMERVQGEARQRAEAAAGQAAAAEGRLPVGAGRARQELPDGRVLPVRAAREEAPRPFSSLYARAAPRARRAEGYRGSDRCRRGAGGPTSPADLL